MDLVSVKVSESSSYLSHTDNAIFIPLIDNWWHLLWLIFSISEKYINDLLCINASFNLLVDLLAESGVVVILYCSMQIVVS